MSDSARRIASLDGVRAIAILMVVISHLSAAPGFFTLPGESAGVLGNLGVRILFVLSGFLISSLLLREHAENGQGNLTRFYIRRFFRIFPAFYVFLLALATASFLGLILLEPGDIPKAALYAIDYCRWDSTSNFVRHIWSLSVEEQFYLVWPVAIWALPLRRVKWIAFGSIALSPFWRLGVFHFLPVWALTIDRRFDCFSDSLASGCLLACLQSTLSQSSQYRALFKLRWMHLIPLAVLCAAFTSSRPNLYLGVSTSVMNVGIALYMFRCILFPPPVLNTFAIRQIGLVSYSTYLWQEVFCSAHAGTTRLAAPL